MNEHETDETTNNLAVKTHWLIKRLYEEAQDEPDCLYWQAAEMLEKFTDHATCWKCKVGNETFTTLDKRVVAEEWSEDFEVTPILLNYNQVKL